MEERNPDLQAALTQVLEENPTSGEHLTPELLVGYHHERLPPEEADAVREHLAACPPCAELLLELVRFGREEGEGEPSHRGGDVTDLEAEADWRALRSRIAESEGPEAGARSHDRVPGKARPPYLAYGLAASLLLIVGLGAWIAELREEVGTLREPQINLPIVNLYGEGFARGGADEGTVRDAEERFVVILNPPTFPAATEHRVEILTAEGQPVWSGRGLQRTEAGNFHLELSRRLLEPGQYRIRLFEGRESIAEFELRLAP